MLNKIGAIPGALKAKLSPKIFCISVQRTGTTSVGQFFKEHNFRVASWGVSRRNNWTLNWFKGDYESIFQSRDFIYNQVFEDDPWFCLDFYKVLFHQFPKSKFVLIERDADKWFDSMVKHSRGKTLGNTYIHSMIYERMNEFNKIPNNNESKYSNQIDNLLPLNESHREKYKGIYMNRNLEVNRFFDFFGSERIVRVKLENTQKWQEIGAFFNIKVHNDYEVHANKSI